MMFIMKTNKKAILGMLVAIVMSLGVMNGVNSRISDSGFQQVSIGCGYMALSGAAAGQIATGGSFLGWTPVGWGMWAGAGVCAL